MEPIKGGQSVNAFSSRHFQQRECPLAKYRCQLYVPTIMITAWSPSPGHAQEVHQLRVVGVHHEHLHQRLDEPGALVVVPETRVPWR